MMGKHKAWWRRVWAWVGTLITLIAMMLRMVRRGRFRDRFERDAQRMKDAPDFIELDEGLDFRLPYLLDDCSFITFWTHGNEAAIRAYCEKTFAPARELDGTVYEPMGDLVLVALLDSDRVVSLHPEDCNKGMLREREVSVVFPLAVRDEDGSPRMRMVLHMPHLWLDSNPVIAAGREVQGFRKCLGAIHVQEDPPPEGLPTVQLPESVVVKAEYLARHAPDCLVETGDVLRIVARVSPLETKSHLSWTEYEKVLEYLKQDLGNPELEQEMFPTVTDTQSEKENEVAERFTHGVFLKQFRDVHDCEKPCYQAVTEAPLLFRPRMESAWVIDTPYQIQFPLHASTAAIRQFFVGDEVDPGDGSPPYLAVPSYRQIGLEFDLVVRPGVTVAQSFPKLDPQFRAPCRVCSAPG